MNKRLQQKRETMDRIFDAAWELCLQHGYECVSVADIAKKADVSVGLVYYHFGSKDAILDQGYIQFDEAMREGMEQAGYADPKEKVKQLFLLYLKLIQRVTLRTAASVYGNQLLRGRDYILDENHYMYAEMLEAFSNLCVPGNDTESYTCMVLCTLRGLILEWCCTGGQFDLIQRGTQFIDQLLMQTDLKQ